jgi:hypothetical protein
MLPNCKTKSRSAILIGSMVSSGGTARMRKSSTIDCKCEYSVDGVLGVNLGHSQAHLCFHEIFEDGLLQQEGEKARHGFSLRKSLIS